MRKYVYLEGLGTIVISPDDGQVVHNFELANKFGLP